MSMRSAFLLSVVLLLSACTGGGGAIAAETAGQPLAGPVSYEVRSWGEIMAHWQVNPDGTGDIWRVSREGKGAAEIRKFRLHLDGAAMRSFGTLSGTLHTATLRPIRCRKEIYDLPYGSVTWDYPAAKQVYAFDAGCFSKRGD